MPAHLRRKTFTVLEPVLLQSATQPSQSTEEGGGAGTGCRPPAGSPDPSLYHVPGRPHQDLQMLSHDDMGLCRKLGVTALTVLCA